MDKKTFFWFSIVLTGALVLGLGLLAMVLSVLKDGLLLLRPNGGLGSIAQTLSLIVVVWGTVYLVAGIKFLVSNRIHNGNNHSSANAG